MTRNALLLGNFVTGLAVLSPAGMLTELAAGLHVSLQQAGLLATFGAGVLCFGSPLMAWATSRIERRTLLSATVAVMALGHAVSALAPDYVSLLIVRLIMLTVAAIYTPQAASTISMIVGEKERPSAIAYIFLGWSLATAIGLPIVTFVTSQVGWRETYGLLALVCALAFVLNLAGLPKGLKGVPVSMQSWGVIARNRLILMLLVITGLATAGQFGLFIYLAPLLTRLTGAGTQTISLTFAGMGVVSVLGNVFATRAVIRFGAYRTSLILLTSSLAGLLVWSVGAGLLAVMLAGLVLVSIGFAAANSMQQARLVAAGPDLAGASISLNTSLIYVGQAVGTGIIGALIAADLPVAVGYMSAAFMCFALAVLLMTNPSRA